MKIALKNLARVCISATVIGVIGLLSACGGANDQTGNASPSAANYSATNLPSFLPTTDMPPSARTIALQMEGGRLNSEELAQTAKTGVPPKPFDGPLLSGAEDLSKSIGNNNSSAAPSFQPRLSAQIRAASLTQAYRFYNPRTTAHFFTTNTAERANIIATYPFMNDEGPAFFTSNAMVTGLSPVHRFYNTQTGVHFFTISEGERAKVAADLPQYIYEGIAYYASQLAGSGLTPLYRFFYASKSFHFFTSNIAERDNIIATLPNYRYEGVGYYVMSSDWQATDVPGTNAAPVANAGVAQNVIAGSVVTLDGSASSDTNVDTLTYAWTLTSKPAGSTATLSSATSAKPTFTADVAGIYVASLTVNDGKVTSPSTSVGFTAALNDTSGPSVGTISVNPVTVDVTSSSQVVTATVVVSDATGINLNALPMPYWYNNTDVASTRINSPWVLTVGNAKQATFTSTVTIPVGAKPGQWSVGSIAFKDTLGYSSTNGGYQQFFTVK